MSEKISKPISGRSEHGTDWDALASLGDEDIDRAITADPTAARALTREWFERAERVPPGHKRAIYIRLDREVLDYFQREGVKGYQSRINAALKAFVRTMEMQAKPQKGLGRAHR